MSRKVRQELSLSQWRVLSGISQTEFARAVGCSRSAVSLIERGERRPRPDLLTRIYGVIPPGVLV